ncbi:hypothetical protein [Algisphaera agarilytica]|uniref:Uncharacterized protein n=1 Tax=Algisphaera agarilytica TaxID=1385975 RepID=A0A7X0H5F0_9BACT|nr:hypothetical protein [Algisphaera agarilytica]MBB6429627.1 hypothetical protein [Algisphaera agarilytica]
MNNRTHSLLLQPTRRRVRRGASVLVGVLALACFNPAGAQDQPTLDELLDLEPAAPASSEDAAPPTTETAPIDEVEEILSGTEAADAFEQAVRDMDRVADRLGDERDPGLDTQRLQESILARLDQLIEAAQQQQSSSSSSSSSSGSSSNQDSSAQNAGQEQGQEPGEQPGQAQGQEPGQTQQQANGENPGGFSPGQVGPIDPGQGAIDEVRIEWGALPPRLRDELTNGLDEPYSPVYRNLTEAYYRRLAEEASE